MNSPPETGALWADQPSLIRPEGTRRYYLSAKTDNFINGEFIRC